MSETQIKKLLTKKSLKELGFEKVVSTDIVDNTEYIYYALRQNEYRPSLFAEKIDGKWVVMLSYYEYEDSPRWTTIESTKTLIEILKGDE